MINIADSAQPMNNPKIDLLNRQNHLVPSQMRYPLGFVNEDRQLI